MIKCKAVPIEECAIVLVGVFSVRHDCGKKLILETATFVNSMLCMVLYKVSKVQEIMRLTEKYITDVLYNV